MTTYYFNFGEPHKVNRDRNSGFNYPEMQMEVTEATTGWTGTVSMPVAPMTEVQKQDFIASWSDMEDGEMRALEVIAAIESEQEVGGYEYNALKSLALAEFAAWLETKDTEEVIL